MKPLQIFIGFDQVEAVAYHVLCHSILSRASVPVSITPIKRSMLKDIHDRPLDEKQSNEFSFTRFLVPYLSDYEGVSLFMDCDMLVTTDIKELFDLFDDQYAVQVVKHDYTPKDNIKYLGTVQYAYPKKNWSSVMLFNNAKCKRLTPEYVNTASGMYLHQFKWLESDDLIGELPYEWNHLVSDMPPCPDAKNIHWTVGGPYFVEYKDCEHASKWFIERALMNNCVQRDQISRFRRNEDTLERNK